MARRSFGLQEAVADDCGRHSLGQPRGGRRPVAYPASCRLRSSGDRALPLPQVRNACICLEGNVASMTSQGAFAPGSISLVPLAEIERTLGAALKDLASELRLIDATDYAA